MAYSPGHRGKLCKDFLTFLWMGKWKSGLEDDLAMWYSRNGGYRYITLTLAKDNLIGMPVMIPGLRWLSEFGEQVAKKK